MTIQNSTLTNPNANASVSPAGGNSTPGTPAPLASPPGVSAAPDSMGSSGSEENKGFIAQISAWISNIVDEIFKCLSNLFSGLFTRSTSQTPGSDSVPQPIPTDNEILTQINEAFVANSNSVLPSDVVDYTLDVFRKIHSPIVKMQAFQAVLNASNSTNEIAKQFYNALPEGANEVAEASKIAFKRSIMATGARDPSEQGTAFADQTIETDIRGALAKRAVQYLVEVLIASSAPSTTGGSGATASPAGAPRTGGENATPQGTTPPVTTTAQTGTPATVTAQTGTPVTATPQQTGTPVPVTPQIVQPVPVTAQTGTPVTATPQQTAQVVPVTPQIVQPVPAMPQQTGTVPAGSANAM